MRLAQDAGVEVGRMTVYQSGSVRRRRWWQRPVVWILAVALAALGVSVAELVRTVMLGILASR